MLDLILVCVIQGRSSHLNEAPKESQGIIQAVIKEMECGKHKILPCGVE